MAILSTDRLLIQRGGASYRIDYGDIKADLGAVGDDLHVLGDLEVDGNVTLGLSTSGCLKTADIYNATKIWCTLDVVGATTFGADVAIAGALTGTSADFSTTLNVDGAATLGSTLAVTGSTTLSNGLDVTNGTTTDVLTVSGASSLAGAVAAGSTVDIVGATTINNTLFVQNAATFDNNIDVAGTVDIAGKLTVTDDAAITGDVTAATVTTTGDITAGAALSAVSSGSIGTTLEVGGDVTINTDKAKIFAATGNATFEGNVTAAFFIGDGSQLTNLQIPGSLNFRSGLDCTTNDPAGDEVAGDFYLNTVTGNLTANWTGIGNAAIEEGEFVYLQSNGDWVIGGGNDNGFVTLSTSQTIAGQKSFSAVVEANAGLTATGQNISADTLTLSGKATSASTVDADADSTLVTKGYVDLADESSVTKEQLTAGSYIDGNAFDGSSAETWDIEATTTATANKLVARDALGDIYAHDLNANDIACNDVSSTGTVLAVAGQFTTLTANSTTLLNLTVTNNGSFGNNVTVTNNITSDTGTVTNAFAAGTIAAGATTLSDALTGTTATFSGALAAATGAFTGLLSAGTFDIDALQPLP